MLYDQMTDFLKLNVEIHCGNYISKTDLASMKLRPHCRLLQVTDSNPDQADAASHEIHFGETSIS